MKHYLNADQLLIGAHTSIAGGPHNALLEGKSIGATTVQLFTANQRQWQAKPLDEEKIELFKKTREETGLKAIMSHASYLINLGSCNSELIKKSRQAFREEIERCLDLGLTFLNFHPGAAIGDTTEACLNRIVESLLEMEEYFVDDEMRLLLETTAGQGSSVGSRFEELSYIIARTKKKIPIGVCIDTCHLFAAGYEVKTEEGWTKTLKEFDQVIGLQHLYAFHLNDSVCPFGSNKDRHANLGEGEIGIDCFKFLMTSPLTREIPKYLETPDGPPVWEKEIWILREFARNTL
jgi:deoxyribonuclease IV